MAGQPWAPLLVSVLHWLVRSAAAGVLLPKCCPLGQSFLRTSSGINCSLIEGDSLIWSIQVYSSSSSTPVPADVSYNFTWKPLPCTGPGQRTIHTDEYFIFTDSSIERDQTIYERTKSYCIEFFADCNETYPVFCAAEVEEEAEEKYLVMGLGFFFSIPFALATLIVYIVIKDLWTLHGSIVVRNMFCFIIASLVNGMTATRIIPPHNEFDLLCGSAGK